MTVIGIGGKVGKDLMTDGKPYGLRGPGLLGTSPGDVELKGKLNWGMRQDEHTFVGIGIKVLIVEDQAWDAELMLHELKRSGYEPQWQRAENEAQFLAGVEWGPDLILADFHLPQFDGFRALELRRELDLDIPLLIISGTIGEDLAVSAMRIGADDYLLKDRMGRLGPAVQRALERTRLRRAEVQALRDLRESEERFRGAFEQASVGVAHLSLDGQFLLVNQKLCDILGYDRQELLKMSAQNVTHQDDNHNGETQEIVEKRYVRKDGSIVWVGLANSTVRGPAGDAKYLVTVVEDITARRRAQALERERATLCETISAMEQALGVVSHELRTPLAGLRAMCEYLETDAKGNEAERNDFIGRIHSEVIRMSQTVNDLLEATRLNGGRARWKWADFSLREACGEAVETMRPLVDERRVRLTVNIEPGDARMQGDSDAVRRLIVNLLSNARKHTVGGQIAVNIRQSTDAAGETWIDIRVEDTGKGIPQSLLAKLREPFALNCRLANAAEEAEIDGNGLGLGICKAIVAAHGGTFTIESKVGQGTTVLSRIRGDLTQPALNGQSRLLAA